MIKRRILIDYNAYDDSEKWLIANASSLETVFPPPRGQMLMLQFFDDQAIIYAKMFLPDDWIDWGDGTFFKATFNSARDKPEMAVMETRSYFEESGIMAGFDVSCFMIVDCEFKDQAMVNRFCDSCCAIDVDLIQ